MSGHAGACRVDTQRSREKSLSRVGVGVGEIGRARERVASGVLFIDFYLSWMSPDWHHVGQLVAVRHPRHVLLDDRPHVQYVGKGTLFPAIYESMAAIIRVAAKFG
jgi:hypothetical protein